jgi:putative transcriptional regulator
MNRFLTALALACCTISLGAIADEDLGKGKLLVATELVQGRAFAESVILLLNIGATGAVGLVVNRPMGALPAQALPELAGIDRYEGTLYWGGPVELFTLRALLHSDAPPDSAVPIFDTVHLAPVDENLLDGASSNANLRFFLGYAGWAPGQLERELAFGSWRIVAATEALVFADDPGGIWRRLMPPPVHRARISGSDPRKYSSQFGKVTNNARYSRLNPAF